MPSLCIQYMGRDSNSRMHENLLIRQHQINKANKVIVKTLKSLFLSSLEYEVLNSN